MKTNIKKNNSEQKSMEKNQKIQVVRGIAVIAVVLIHTCPLGMYQVIARPFINFCVATFLFLSGYLTKTENDNWPAFFRKRILRVLIPYVIWNVSYTLLDYYFNGWGGFRILFVHLISTKASGHLYFIFVYIQFVLLTPVLGKLLKSKYRWMGWFVAPISTVFFKYYFLLSGREMNHYLSVVWDVCCLGWFTFYYLGLMLGNGIKVCRYNYKKLAVMYGISILLQMGEGYIWFRLGEGNCGSQIKLTSFLTSTLFLLLVHEYLNSNIPVKGKFSGASG